MGERARVRAITGTSGGRLTIAQPSSVMDPSLPVDMDGRVGAGVVQVVRVSANVYVGAQCGPQAGSDVAEINPVGPWRCVNVVSASPRKALCLWQASAPIHAKVITASDPAVVQLCSYDGTGYGPQFNARASYGVTLSIGDGGFVGIDASDGAQCLVFFRSKVGAAAGWTLKEYKDVAVSPTNLDFGTGPSGGYQVHKANPAADTVYDCSNADGCRVYLYPFPSAETGINYLQFFAVLCYAVGAQYSSAIRDQAWGGVKACVFSTAYTNWNTTAKYLVARSPSALIQVHGDEWPADYVAGEILTNVLTANASGTVYGYSLEPWCKSYRSGGGTTYVRALFSATNSTRCWRTPS